MLTLGASFALMRRRFVSVYHIYARGSQFAKRYHWLKLSKLPHDLSSKIKKTSKMKKTKENAGKSMTDFEKLPIRRKFGEKDRLDRSCRFAI